MWATTSAFGQSGTIVYENDFDLPVGREWSDDRRASTPIGNDQYLGRFGGEPVALDGEDTAGPVVVGVAVEEATATKPEEHETEENGDDRSADGARLVVFGDSDFLTDLDIAIGKLRASAQNISNAQVASDAKAIADQAAALKTEVEQIREKTRKATRFALTAALKAIGLPV